MTHGLRVWDENGQIVLDVTDRLSRIHGVYKVSINHANWVTVYVPGMEPDGTWGFAGGMDFLASIRMISGGFQAKVVSFSSYQSPYNIPVIVMRF